MFSFRILLTAAPTAALLTLAACNNEPTIINSGPLDTQAADLAKAKPVALPPSIAASRTYRCKDNSIIYVDFMSDQTTANFRTKKGEDPVLLTAPEAGKPFTAEGYSISGDGPQVEIAAPGKPAQSCKA